MDQPPLPTALDGFTADLADELAAAYADQVVYPHRTVIEWPGRDSRFPGWPTPVLLLAVENQGVCAWGIPLDGDDDPPVLVGGELSDRTERTVRYATGVDAYVRSRRWDRSCLSDGLLVQAQAAVLDAASLAFLRGRYSEVPSTSGWPGNMTYRFQTAAMRIMLWAGTDQCDWWISGRDADRLTDAITALLPYSDLRSTLWSNEAEGQALLDRIRRTH